ncbi:hypothetical protein MBM_05868 [Drepanopeziza brunnea f. sp. 'multigermtubi' MB_m1]|uniref:Uncharacterized protein n=1 Tax=Marssonina brunnea f. sp. multigermtubi (strain MB_m1) TaxID=1072389 RepID=K1WTS4_MARBU|nr:uncharacterized protein MBM_05868 [Drepanopeziza brunnea f. sp. 'multigermtubi' MB_m1]EKD15857.1 hypothetical protein MBM_05868 [Drepanopeziza brunnea f. sp. 'multigermtubi' MB_m1]
MLSINYSDDTAPALYAMYALSIFFFCLPPAYRKLYGSTYIIKASVSHVDLFAQIEIATAGGPARSLHSYHLNLREILRTSSTESTKANPYYLTITAPNIPEDGVTTAVIFLYAAKRPGHQCLTRHGLRKGGSGTPKLTRHGIDSTTTVANLDHPFVPEYGLNILGLLPKKEEEKNALSAPNPDHSPIYS